MDKLIQQKIYEYFKDNESTKQYIDIISTALERQKGFQPTINKYVWGTVGRKKKIYFDFYTEMHHIIPRSINKELEDYKPNWVVLTGEEHFTIHKLLIDMCINKDHYYSMCEAFWRMCTDNRGKEVTPEEYALARKLAAEAKSIRMTGIKQGPPSEETKKKLSEAQKGNGGEPVECYIIVDGKEIILDRFDSRKQAGEKANGCQAAICDAVNGKTNSSGTYNIETKQYNKTKIGGSVIIPNNAYPNTYRLHWRDKNSTSTIVITPKELYECYIIIDNKEIILDRFKSLQDAEDKTSCFQSGISKASNGNTKPSGTYNLETKQYNLVKMRNGNIILPSNNYPTTYKLYWRKIKGLI